jgi:hypothetical protein
MQAQVKEINQSQHSPDSTTGKQADAAWWQQAVHRQEVHTAPQVIRCSS